MNTIELQTPWISNSSGQALACDVKQIRSARATATAHINTTALNNINKKYCCYIANPSWIHIIDLSIFAKFVSLWQHMLTSIAELTPWSMVWHFLCPYTCIERVHEWLWNVCGIISHQQGPLLLKWININPNMNKKSQARESVEWNYWTIPKLQRFHRLNVGVDKSFHRTS